jgi:hypothetical protein
MFLNSIESFDEELLFKELEGRLGSYDAVDFGAGCCWEERLKMLCLVLGFWRTLILENVDSERYLWRRHCDLKSLKGKKTQMPFG